MMDTVLNIGMNDEVAEKMVERTGNPRFVYDLYRRLIQMFGSVVMGVPDEAFELVITARREKSGAAIGCRSDGRRLDVSHPTLQGNLPHICPRRLPAGSV